MDVMLRLWCFFLMCVTATAHGECSHKEVFLKTRQEITAVLADKPKNLAPDDQLASLISIYLDRPYHFPSIGEGDWQPTKLVYQGGAKHPSSLPVYRSDVFDCQSLVQFLIALMMSQNLNQFDINYLKLSYKQIPGNKEIVRFANRNHIIETDFNYENHNSGILRDLTPTLSNRVAYRNYVIDRKLFLKKLNTNSFDKKIRIRLSYIPLHEFFASNTLTFNEKLLANIPTPTLAEFVSDYHKWFIQGRNSKEFFGTELAISHTGILYRKQFRRGEVLYQKISCQDEECQVSPIVCQKTVCNELMFVHATNAYPNHYFWSKHSKDYFCSRSFIPSAKQIGFCNRVEQLPFRDYLFNRIEQAKKHGYDDHLIGIHFEGINVLGSK